MEAAIHAYLRSVQDTSANIHSEELNFLASKLSIITLKAGDVYHYADRIPQDLGFVFRGLLKAYYRDPSGNEISQRFVAENSYATQYGAFISGSPSPYTFQCIEDSIIVNLPYKHMQNCFHQFVGMERYGRMIAESVLTVQQKRIESFLFKTAEQRYLEFEHDYPQLLKRISPTDLAAHLGMEEEMMRHFQHH